MVESKLLEAFEMMWEHYPESVMLVNKAREVLAVNRAGRSIGRAPGMRCSQFEPAQSHIGCKANEALDTASATYRKKKGPSGDVISFWLPVEGYPGYLIHFSVGSIKTYEYTV